MRRKPGSLLPIEISLLGAGVSLLARGEPEFHGYAIARAIRERDEAKRLIAHGTLYRALERMEVAKLLESRLEDAELAARENRPRRRLYRVSALGQETFENVVRAAGQPSPSFRRGMNPS